jgi:hypothetical protein
MTGEQYEKFRHTAVHELMSLNALCQRQFSIGSWEHWRYDAESGTLTFSEGGVPRVIATVQVVGTTSTKSHTWLWGWANQSVPPARTALLAEVRRFGEVESLSILIQPEWPDDEHHGWEMAAITAKIIGAKGAYRAPRDSGGYSYYVYTDVRLANDL